MQPLVFVGNVSMVGSTPSHPPPPTVPLSAVLCLQKARDDLPCPVLTAIREFGDRLTVDPHGWSQALRCFQSIIVRLPCAPTWAIHAAVRCDAVCVQV